MKISRTIAFTAAAAVAGAALISVVEAAAPAARSYSVTITNVTRGQVITPPVVAVHGNGFQLFTPGQPAIPELRPLAEDGVTSDLVALLEVDPDVLSVIAAAGPLLPGQSVTLDVPASGAFRRLTVVGMLASTNDGIFAVNGVDLPAHGALALDGVVYDAGTETNSESCATIPGPPCGNPMVPDTSAAEGFVHVHAGIHGIGDLVAADLDWRNPAAEIVVVRTN